MQTKFVRDGREGSPCCAASAWYSSRPRSTSATTPRRNASSSSAASAPICAVRLTPKCSRSFWNVVTISAEQSA
jgi:hypothetical protein